MTVTPEQKLIGFPYGSVLDFWQWAFADLCDDDIKGWFAEWIVIMLLKIQSKRRISWADSDIIVGNADHLLRIEVKSTSYWQSWKLLDEFGKPRKPPFPPVAENNIRWNCKPSLTSFPPTDGKLVVPGHKSDLFVFALQNEKDPERWNALDHTQWTFYLASKEQLIGKQSITPSQLQMLGAGPLTAYEFSVRGRSLMVERGFGAYTGSFLAERMANEAQYAHFLSDEIEL